MSSIKYSEDKTNETIDEETKNEIEQKPSESNLEKMIEELKKKIELMTSEVKKLKEKKPYIDSNDSDLNDSVMQSASQNKKSYNYFLKKQSFLKIMDELDDLAEHFSNIDYRVTKRIDSIADRLRFYDKG